MILKIHTDGGSKGNPGPASIGVVFYLDGKEAFTYREDIGITTNNVAEYTAVIRALEHLTKMLDPRSLTLKNLTSSIQHPVSSIAFYSDSTLLVNQVNGLFKIKQPHIIPLVAEVRRLVAQLNLPVTFQYVPREQNVKADALVNNK